MVRLETEKSSNAKPKQQLSNWKELKCTPKHIHDEFVAQTYSPVHPIHFEGASFVQEDPDCPLDASTTANDLLNRCTDILNSYPVDQSGTAVKMASLANNKDSDQISRLSNQTILIQGVLL